MCNRFGIIWPGAASQGRTSSHTRDRFSRGPASNKLPWALSNNPQVQICNRSHGTDHWVAWGSLGSALAMMELGGLGGEEWCLEAEILSDT